jgi:hypothetical protein
MGRPRASRTAAAVLVLSVAGVLAACNVGGAAQTAAPQVRSTFTRACDTTVSGALPAGWRSSSLKAGDITLYLWGAVDEDGHRGLLPAHRFAPVSPGRYNGWKMMLIAPAGHAVEISVALASLPRVRLAFELGLGGAARLSDGESRVQLDACPRRAFYNGGLLVAGAQCARLDVLDRATGRTSHVVAAFGQARCA